jgi:sulfide:quinone oxidoreductase
MKRVLILGAGTGGMIVANSLAREMRREIVKGEVEISLFDASSKYYFEAGFVPYIVSAFDEENLAYDRIKLLDPKVKAFFGSEGTVTKIDLKNRKIHTATGKEFSYKYLVIALGATYEPSLLPGLLDDYHTFYTFEGAKEIRKLLSEFQGGTIALLLATSDIAPKCPIVSGKAPLLIDSYLKNVRMLRGRYKIVVATPQDHLHAQPEINKVLEEKLKDQGIEYVYNFEPAQVDARNKEVVSTKGEKLKYDLLLTVPPHRGPKVIGDSGIGDPFNFVPTDRYTLNYRKGKETYDDVFVVGDVTNIGVARAGAVAHYEAIVVSHNIAAEIKGYGDRWLFYGETICPYLGAIYTPAEKGEAWMPWWTYVKNARAFVGNKWGWYLIKMYYLTIPLTLRGLI